MLYKTIGLTGTQWGNLRRYLDPEKLGLLLALITTTSQEYIQEIEKALRGRTLMIGGLEEKQKMDLFFPRICLLKIIFPGEGFIKFIKFIFYWRRTSKIFFSRFPLDPPQIIRGVSHDLQNFVSFPHPKYGHSWKNLLPKI